MNTGETKLKVKVNNNDYAAQATLFLNESKHDSIQGSCSVVVHHEALSRLRPGFKSRCEHFTSDIPQDNLKKILQDNHSRPDLMDILNLDQWQFNRRLCRKQSVLVCSRDMLVKVFAGNGILNRYYCSTKKN